MTRRKYSTCLLALLIAMSFAVGQAYASGQQSEQYLVYVGTYTDGASKGIYSYRYDARTGKLQPLGLAAAAVNPSFLAVHPNSRFLYAVNEVLEFQGGRTGAVSAYSIDERGGLTLLNQVPSHGADPCYVTLDRTGSYVLVANYTGGSVATFPILPDGRLGGASASVKHVGASGADPKRQDAPHAHSIDTSPDNRHAMVADLGLDQVLIYRFDAATGSLVPNDPPHVSLRNGAGPRHLTFHPNGRAAYALNELHSTVSVLAFDPAGGGLRELQTVSMLPKGYRGKKEAAEVQVHPSGKFLYASNRGHDSIAIFAIDRKRYTLTPVERVPTGGKEPRFFTIDPSGERILAANQNSGTIHVFAIDPRTGRLKPGGQVLDVPAPVAIVFVPLTGEGRNKSPAR